MAIHPPTTTFKGEHDGIGNLYKNVIKQAELAEIDCCPTTRIYMPLLRSQRLKTLKSLDDPERKTHEIDQHLRVLVTDRPHALPSDNADNRVLITNESLEKYECTNVQGIQSAYNTIQLTQVRSPLMRLFLLEMHSAAATDAGGQ